MLIPKNENDLFDGFGLPAAVYALAEVDPPSVYSDSWMLLLSLDPYGFCLHDAFDGCPTVC